MRNLSELGKQAGTDKATYHDFCQFYQAYLPASVESVLEFGVLRGDSLRMWQKYYPGAEVIGVDIDEKDLNGFETYVADQDSLKSLIDLKYELSQGIRGRYKLTSSGRRWGKAELLKHYNLFDIIIDDGGHTMTQQRNTLNTFIDSCKYYIIEDLHSSLHPDYGDGSMLKWVMDGLPGLRQYIKDIFIFTKIHSNGERSITAIIKTNKA